MTPLQTHLPYRPWSDPGLSRLPGVLPADAWLIRDEAFAGQMALRDRLVAERSQDVLGEGASPEAVAELMARVLIALRDDPGYDVGETSVRRPDGVEVPLDGPPLAVLARLVQEDLLIHEKRGDEHVLAGGALLFPASWTFAQKLGRPLSSIHIPVERYDETVARSVQRMFDRVPPDRVLWRANWLVYRDPDLFQPRREGEARPRPEPDAGYLRSERQSFLKLPGTGAVIFAIHTYVVPLAVVSDDPPPG